MSWSQKDFVGPDGVKVLLQRLSASPLVRKSLPNAAAIMSEYFSFKRRPQEPIAQFLARESLGFEEFAEALAQLKEEKEGHDPALRNFDLPDMSPHPDESDHDGRLWRQSDRYQWRHWEPPDGSDGGHRAPEREDGYAGVPQSDPGEASPPRAQAPVT